MREAAVGVRLDDGGVDITPAAHRSGIAELPRDVIDRLRQALFPSRRSASAASTVPAQVRKSLLVNSSPAMRFKYALTSAESTARISPRSSMYWKSS
jgi:hypothetical protein